MHSLEELEARMRGGTAPHTTAVEPPRVTKTDEDLSAFKKLVNICFNDNLIKVRTFNLRIKDTL